MSQPALFHHTPSWQLALLAAAGIAGSGFLAYQAGAPVVRLLSAPQPTVNSQQLTANSRPGLIAGAENAVEPSDTVASLKSQVANLVARMAELEDLTDGDAVLGESTEALPVREEFPPAVNLLRNSSFEENSDGAPRQWNYNQWSNSGNTFTTAEAIRTGTAGLKVLGSATTNFGFSQPTTKMVERRDYAFSIWVKPVNTNAHTVKLSFWDEVNNKEASAKSFSLTGTKEWSRLVLQVNNKNTWNGKKWYPMVTVNGLTSGAVYFDDAQLEEASSYTPYHFAGGGATQSHVSVLGDGSVEIDAHGNVYPAVNGIGGLGTGDNKFAELKLSKASIDKNGSLTLEGDITVDGNGTFKGAMNFSGTIKSHLIPDQDSTYDLGSSAKKWRVGYIDQLHLENGETINNNLDSDITFIENNTGGNNTLVFDMNAAADAVELRNDTEDLRLRAAGNGNLVLRAGDGATNSNVNGNDLFLAAEDTMTVRAATYDLQTSGNTITMTALNSSITLSTGSTETGFINLRSAGTLTLDTTANRTNINVLAGGPSSTSLTLRSLNGGIDLSSSSASGAGDIKLRSAGTLHLDTSANNTNILANTGTGRLVATSNNAGITAIQLLATNGGVDISTSGVGGLGELRLRAGGSLKLDTSGNNNNILVDSGTGDLLANIGTGTFTAVDDTTVALALRATRGGIELSTSNANGNGNMILKSGGTLQLSTSGTNSNVLLQAGTGAFTVNAGASTHTYTGDYGLTNTGQVSVTSNQAAIDAIALLTTNGGIDISTSGVGGLGELRLRAGGSLKLDTSGNNNNILVDSGTGDLLANVGTTTWDAQDDAINAISLSASRGGINLSSSSASGSGDIKIRSAGTLQLDTSAANSSMLVRTGTGTVDVSAGVVHIRSANDDVNAIRLLADRGGINISSGSAGGNGNITIKSAGTLQLDTSATNANIMVRAGTGRIDLSGDTILINSGAGTLNLSSNSTITVASSTTASFYGETSTLIGRPTTNVRVHGKLCVEGSGDGTSCPAGDDGRLFVNTKGEATDDPGDVFDVAEYYPASEPVDPGTVVVADASARATVKKSAYPYQRVLGVVSSTPAVMIDEGWFGIGSNSQGQRDALKPLVALVGRVPVKVTNENGDIRVGDRLVASSTAGYAMKAVKQGMTLGMAIEDVDFKDAAEAKVMTFVNVSWYFPEVVDALEKEHQLAQAVGIAPDPAAALADAVAAAPDLSPSTALSDLSNLSSLSGLAKPSLTLAIPPTEFPNIAVSNDLTVGKTLTVNGTAKFEGEVEVLADATFAKSVIVVGDLRIGGNLEIGGAVVTAFTAGSSLSAGDPVAVNGAGQAVRAGGGQAVVGVAAGAAGAGDKVNVAVAGKVGGLSGLTAGARYYVSESGALTTDGKGGQSVGVAVSGSELLVQPGVGLPAEVKTNTETTVPAAGGTTTTETPGASTGTGSTSQTPGNLTTQTSGGTTSPSTDSATSSTNSVITNSSAPNISPSL